MKKIISFTQRVIAALLVLIFATAGNMVAFAAVDNNQEPNRSIYGEVTNPHFMDTQPTEDVTNEIGGEYLAEVKYSSVYDEAKKTELAKIVRDSMIARVSPIPITINTNRTDINNIVPEIVNLALSEEMADTSSAGDYLAWNYSGYKYSGTSLVTDDGYEYNINLFVNYYTTASEEAQVASRINDALNAMNVNSLSEYDKIKSIYDYICKVCNYDYSRNNNGTKFSAYAAIVNGSAVCQGYCTLLYRMLREAGIENRIITSTSHSWNIVKIGNQYYNLDATWDDSNYDNGIAYSYFLKCSNHFGDHNCQQQYTSQNFTARYPIANVCYSNCNEQKASPPPVGKVEVSVPVQNSTKSASNTTVHKAVNVTPTTITVKKTKIKSLTKKSKGFKVKWNKISNANGYEIQYSTSKKFTKGTTKKVVIKKNTTSKAISKLKGNKKYYIKIRAYKNYNGTKCYSSWSTVNNVKTKK